MYVFKTKNGVEHIGNKDILINPCGDYSDSRDEMKGFLSFVCGKFFPESEVVESRMLPELDIEIRDSCPSDNDITGTSELLCREPLEIREHIDRNLRSELPNIIKNWVILNCECSSTIVIGPGALVRTKGELTIKAGTKIPRYLHIMTGKL